MLPPPLTLSISEARCFALRATGLWTPHDSVDSAVAHHGYIQIDPINICGRMQDLILRNRVRGYREQDLVKFVHGEREPLPAIARAAFEHHLPSSGVLVALELGAWPYLQSAMRRRTRSAGAWSGRLSSREKELADRILAEVREKGPLGSDGIVDERRAKRVWGAATLVKATMQKLFFHGQLLIAQRANGRRLYDLPERVLPPATLQAPEPTAAEVARWEVELKLRQRRLVRLTRQELSHAEDLVYPLQIQSAPTAYCLRRDVPLLERAGEPISPPPPNLLLAPLDPLIYDRVLTRALWQFDYTWEVYTPPAKRKRGYYALPLLVGEHLVGDVDLKADRPNQRLTVVSRRVRRGFRSQAAVDDLARFLGLRAPRRKETEPR